ncbi:MAG: T9SS type A sorting domain-containing protein [Bacteroidales bacterium]|nr:T9SS type A sorting domain-containing protein [Bacteroidales bacterium]
MWNGIIVWGTANDNQFTPGAQGKLTIINGGTIENAIAAVRLARTDGMKYVSGYEGGIIQNNDAHFINNRTGVRFYPYRNMVSGVEVDNLSYFQNTEFLTDDKLADESLPVGFLHMHGVKGISIQGCSFTNSRPDEEAAIRERGIGIFSEDAHFIVSNFCPGGYPCEEPIRSSFRELNYGIHASNPESAKIFEVCNSDFYNNLTGIYAKGVDFANITFNNFELRNVSIVHPLNDIFGGLFLDNCTGYTVEENNFYNDNPYDPHNEIQSIGITVDNSGNDFNMIYRNTFDRLHLGILAQNNNRGTSELTGLKLKCNRCSNNQGDFAVTSDGSSLNPGISWYQGAYDPRDNTAPAGNWFSHNVNNDPYSDFNNTLRQSWIIYFHHLGNPYDPWVPVYYQNITPHGYNFFTSFDEVCPSHFQLGGGFLKSAPAFADIELLKERMFSMQQSRDSAAIALRLWIDAGNTPQLNDEVAYAIPAQSLEIYDDLMAYSPYLSDTILATSIGKNEVLINAMIRDIMVANPHGAKREALIEALEQRVPPVPEYMMAQIMAGLDSLSLKEQYESEIAWYEQERALAFNQLMNIYLTDSVLQYQDDSIASLIYTHGTLHQNYLLAKRYLDNSDTTNAFLQLNSIPDRFVMNPDQTVEYQDYITLFTLLKNLKQSGYPLDSLDIPSRQVLYQMVGKHSRPAIMAQNILQHIDTVYYPEKYILPVSGPQLRRYDAGIPFMNPSVVQNSVMKVYPNPCRDYFIIDYSFEKIPRNAFYSITDPTGRTIDADRLNRQQDQLIKRTSSLSPGLYTVRFNIDGREEKALKISVIK